MPTELWTKIVLGRNYLYNFWTEIVLDENCPYNGNCLLNFGPKLSHMKISYRILYGNCLRKKVLQLKQKELQNVSYRKCSLFLAIIALISFIDENCLLLLFLKRNFYKKVFFTSGGDCPTENILSYIVKVVHFVFMITRICFII